MVLVRRRAPDLAPVVAAPPPPPKPVGPRARCTRTVIKPWLVAKYKHKFVVPVGVGIVIERPDSGCAELLCFFPGNFAFYILASIIDEYTVEQE